MNTDLQALYQEVILDHNRNPRHFGTLTDCTHSAEGHNPLCGDQIHLELNIQNNCIESIGFIGQGCAISTASASLMTEKLNHCSTQEAEAIFHAFHAALVNEQDPDLILLGKLAVLMGVKTYPTRIKCATLAWHTLIAALSHQVQAVSTEEEAHE